MIHRRGEHVSGTIHCAYQWKYDTDCASSVSFFALPDFGFPKQPHHHDGDNDGDLFQMHEGSLGDMLAAAEGYLNRASRPDEGRVKAFIKYVLLYNILPEHTPLHELGKNNTFATALKLPDGSLDGKPLRVRVKRNIGLDPRPSVNFVSKILVPDIPVKNGKPDLLAPYRAQFRADGGMCRCCSHCQQAHSSPSFYLPDRILVIRCFLYVRKSLSSWPVTSWC